MMNRNQYCRHWGEKLHISDTGSYYFITFECYKNESHKKEQTITLNKGGFVEIDNCWYDVSSGSDVGQEIFCTRFFMVSVLRLITIWLYIKSKFQYIHFNKKFLSISDKYIQELVIV